MTDLKWLKGALLLGFTFFLAVYIMKPIGVSTQFSVASGIIHSAIDSDVIQPDETRETGYRSTNAYYDKSEGKLAKSIKHPWNYDFIFVLAIPLGALIGFLTDKLIKKSNKNTDVYEKSASQQIGQIETATKEPSTKMSLLRTYLPAFVGGFLLLFGARMADGCTSGHMMSGIMQGSVSGYIFAAAVFAVAIPTALLSARNNSIKRQED